MTIPQIEEVIGKLNYEIDRIYNTLRDQRDDINELREQLGVQRPDLKAEPGRVEPPSPRAYTDRR